MELNHLRTFVAVAEEKNVTRAAKRLYMTPPAVSAHIKALEEELNVILFVRTPQGMQITEKGTRLKAKADETLRAAQDMVNHATQMQDYLMGRLVIGLNATPSYLKVAPLSARMIEQCPGIELSFVASMSASVLDGLQAHSLDAGFIFGASPRDCVSSYRLATADLVIAVPKQWESRLPDAQWADIAQLPWITSNYYCPFQIIFEDLFKQRHLAYRQIVQSDDEVTKCELVSAGIGLALLERSEAEDAAKAGKLAIWPCEPIPCDLYFAVARDRHDDPLIEALKTAVFAIWHRS